MEYSLINQNQAEQFKETIYDFFFIRIANGFRRQFYALNGMNRINYEYLVRIFDNISSKIIKLQSEISIATFADLCIYFQFKPVLPTL